MPVDMCNAPATFEKLMEYVLAGLPWTVCLVYLYDIILHGITFDEKLESLQQVFDSLQDAGLMLSASKCSLFRQETKFLGHLFSGSREDINNEVLAMSSVFIRTESFLGWCSYYRRFMRSFADIASPFNRLTEKNQQFVWGKDQEEASQKVKVLLTSSPILAFPCEGGIIILDSHASESAVEEPFLPKAR